MTRRCLNSRRRKIQLALIDSRRLSRPYVYTLYTHRNHKHCSQSTEPVILWVLLFLAATQDKAVPAEQFTSSFVYMKCWARKLQIGVHSHRINTPLFDMDGQTHRHIASTCWNKYTLSPYLGFPHLEVFQRSFSWRFVWRSCVEATTVIDAAGDDDGYARAATTAQSVRH